MKTIQKLSIIILSVLALSCSKKEDSAPSPIVYQEEDYLAGYLSTTNFTQNITNFINSGDYEFGNEFIPLVKGKITSLKVKLPDSRSNLRVTLWDKASGLVLKTEVVNVAAANTSYVFDIVDIELVKDKEYTITMNSNDWYNERKTDNSSVVYPITVGNIKITSYKYASGTAQVYPTSSALNYYAGDLSFNFQRLE